MIGDSRVAIAPARNHDMAPETFPERAVSLAQIEFLQPGRRCGHRQRAAFRDRNHPLVEAGPARDQFAEAAEPFVRRRTPRRRNRLVQVIRRRPLSHQLSLCLDGLAAARGAVDPPEFKRRARGGQRHLAENGARHKFKRCFKFAAGPICPRHHRDSHRAHAVDERRRGYLAPVHFFDSHDCVDFSRAQRNPFNRFD